MTKLRAPKNLQDYFPYSNENRKKKHFDNTRYNQTCKEIVIFVTPYLLHIESWSFQYWTVISSLLSNYSIQTHRERKYNKAFLVQYIP